MLCVATEINGAIEAPSYVGEGGFIKCEELGYEAVANVVKNRSPYMRQTPDATTQMVRVAVSELSAFTLHFARRMRSELMREQLWRKDTCNDCNRDPRKTETTV